jgi:hypothetical protein
LLFLDDIYYWCSNFIFHKNIVENNNILCENNKTWFQGYKRSFPLKSHFPKAEVELLVKQNHQL